MADDDKIPIYYDCKFQIILLFCRQHNGGTTASGHKDR